MSDLVVQFPTVGLSHTNVLPMTTRINQLPVWATR